MYATIFKQNNTVVFCYLPNTCIYLNKLPGIKSGKIKINPMVKKNITPFPRNK